MKRITKIFAVLLMSLLLVSGAAADRPEPTGDPVFMLDLTEYPVLVNEPEFMPPHASPLFPETWRHLRIRDLKQTGDVVEFQGDNEVLDGWFEYCEDINLNPDHANYDEDEQENWEPFATQQGDMTLTIEGDTIDVRFVGQAIVRFIIDGALYPEITVTNQPWNIKGGTGKFSNIHGNGTRSTGTCQIEEGLDFPCVKYYGDIRF